MTETRVVRGETVEVVEVDGEPRWRCPYCGGDYHPSGLGNHMANWCDDRPEETPEPMDEEPPDEEEEEEPPEDTPDADEEEAEVVCPNCGNPDNGEDPQVYTIRSRESKTTLKTALQEAGRWGPEVDETVEGADYACWSCGWAWP